MLVTCDVGTFNVAIRPPLMGLRAHMCTFNIVSFSVVSFDVVTFHVVTFDVSDLRHFT